MWNEYWRESARCRTSDPDALFVSGALQHEAKRLCRACPVSTECLAEALDAGIEYGVWGGLTERERRALLRRRPTVVSWRELLETVRDEQVEARLTAKPQRAAKRAS